MNEMERLDQIIGFEKLLKEVQPIIFKAIMEEYPVTYRPYLYQRLQGSKVFFTSLPDTKVECVQTLLREEKMRMMEQLAETFSIQLSEALMSVLLDETRFSFYMDLIHSKGTISSIIRDAYEEQVREFVQLFGYLIPEDVSFCEWVKKQNLNRIVEFEKERFKKEKEFKEIEQVYLSKYHDIYQEKEAYDALCLQTKQKYEYQFLNFLKEKELLGKQDLLLLEQGDMDWHHYLVFSVFYSLDFEPGYYQEALHEHSSPYLKERWKNYLQKSNCVEPSPDTFLEIESMRQWCRRQYIIDTLGNFSICKELTAHLDKIHQGTLNEDILVETYRNVFSGVAGQNVLMRSKNLEEGLFNKNFITFDFYSCFLTKSSLWNIVIHEYIHSISHFSWKRVMVMDEVLTQYMTLKVLNKVKFLLQEKTGFVDYEETHTVYEKIFPYTQDLIEEQYQELYDRWVRSSLEEYQKQYAEGSVEAYFQYLEQIYSDVVVGNDTEEMLEQASQYEQNMRKK